MELKKLTERIFYYPHQPEFDRPMLAYLGGDRFSLAVDAGYSAGHVDEFYAALDRAGLKKPDFTVITHWHYDHTFGMHRIHGVSAALERTNAFLAEQREHAADAGYLDTLKRADIHFEREYRNCRELKIVLSPHHISKDAPAGPGRTDRPGLPHGISPLGGHGVHLCPGGEGPVPRGRHKRGLFQRATHGAGKVELPYRNDRKNQL